MAAATQHQTTRYRQAVGTAALPAGQRPGLAGLSLLQLLALVCATVLTLLGTLLGGRAYIASAAPDGLVSQPVTVEAATAQATVAPVASSASSDLREPSSARSRQA